MFAGLVLQRDPADNEDHWSIALAYCKYEFLYYPSLRYNFF